ncbi:YkyA family protein [Pseudalkalibacillus berkeleyi]|uniref:YkyA family protein n=1 Tax=Pseudalkalibacillus berkeleyi TaxID=1069813 RepID=A0ABS9GZC6_9BACL|nr:YkyA family protein [Pseudalkalibacillus berkeleyi]MCF6136938.1 YkyA family protein [Pseudalkalibacillus berkeleyi]
MSVKKSIVLIFLTIGLLVSGCSVGQSTEEKIHEHLEETVSLEKGFGEVQQSLVDAEQKEQKLFNEILALSMKDIDQITKLADQAIVSAETRQKHIKQEKESIQSAYNNFKTVKELSKEIEDEKVQTAADHLIETMDQRFESYQGLHKAYVKALEKDLELYELLKKEDLSLDELKKHTETLNKHYEEVLTKQDKFNSLTDQYNEKKKSFYKQAGLSTGKIKDS